MQSYRPGVVMGRIVKFFGLYKCVTGFGGFQAVDDNGKWAHILFNEPILEPEYLPMDPPTDPATDTDAPIDPPADTDAPIDPPAGPDHLIDPPAGPIPLIDPLAGPLPVQKKRKTCHL
ncbi:hypothetical protein V6N13_077408 [Hibiscus sabdariffa]|uniref:ARID domain-containing protein n=1 Tax=Hibiscus sabdariffa TaxID=183260 RepID=A0ABR2CP23_9ROSI